MVLKGQHFLWIGVGQLKSDLFSVSCQEKKNTSEYERAPVRMVGALFLTFHIPLSACFLCPVRSTGLSCLPI